MLKLEFKNATAEDHGYGLNVNGKSLESIISTALGTKVDGAYGRNYRLPVFSSNCCNITVIIDPQPVTTCIEDDRYVWSSVEELEEQLYEQFKKKDEKADPEE